MIKYITHKLKTQSINEESLNNEKIDCYDSGTESDGDLDLTDTNDRSIETRMNSSCNDIATSPECSAESPTLSPTSNLIYDHNSSEEELEVIMTKPIEKMSYSNENMNQNQKIILNDGEISPKRCSSSTFLEKRKRSLAHNSDDEVRQFLESHPYHHYQNMLAPVNFRTSPPLEALKPHRGHLMVNSLHFNCNSLQQPLSVQQRSTTPLILVETGRGIENIRISCDSPLATSNGSGSTPSSSSIDLRSISPPAKVFAVSPRQRNRIPRSHQIQRLQRRPHLDFDKMQVSNRIISSPGV